jgi:hypothetical protein
MGFGPTGIGCSEWISSTFVLFGEVEAIQLSSYSID